uniref:Big-1 domain-containing protein n=1 Tax=Solibacter usitatus (strain Ellin6076) TaxID=234267 RepID=Q029I1_SOLUE
MAFAQVAILQIKVVEGEGTVHVPGARSQRPLTVEVTDETGRPVTGAAVSFHLPEDGPGGIFGNGLRTEIVITDARGRASLHGLQANRTGGRFQLRILASKEQARAGIVSFQYIAETKSTTPVAAAASVSHRKWIMIGAGIAAGAVASLVASQGGSTARTEAAPPVVPPALTIGTPVITVGKP